MTSVEGSLRRLERLNEKCGGRSAKTTAESKGVVDAEVDTSKMSAYEKGQYNIASCIKRARDNISYLNESGSWLSIGRRTEVSNSIRRDISTMKKDAVGLQRLAVKENRKEDYAQLMTHIKKTEQLQRAQYGGHAPDDGLSDLTTGFNGNVAVAFNPNEEMQNFKEPLVSARDDEEFALFFEQTKKRDVEIDHALDRIGLGLTRLQENAVVIKDELEIQEKLLDTTEAKVEGVHSKLSSMNSRMSKAIKALDKEKMAIYIFCCILLLGIIGSIYFIAK